MEIPTTLGWWRGVPGGAEWLDRLPRLVAECAAQWELRLGAALPGGNVSLVLAVQRSDGSPAVLKVNFPEEESEHEADALQFWHGAGAVRLLEHDPRRRALDQLTAELGLDRERLRGWGIVHALAWGISDDGVEQDMIACAGWLASA